MGYILIFIIWFGIYKLFEVTDYNILLAAAAGAIVDLIFYILLGALVSQPLMTLLTVIFLFFVYLLAFYLLRKGQSNYIYYFLFALIFIFRFFII